MVRAYIATFGGDFGLGHANRSACFGDAVAAIWRELAGGGAELEDLWDPRFGENVRNHDEPSRGVQHGVRSDQLLEIRVVGRIAGRMDDDVVAGRYHNHADRKGDFMRKMIFGELAGVDLKVSTAFYTALGGTLNAQFYASGAF